MLVLITFVLFLVLLHYTEKPKFKPGEVLKQRDDKNNKVLIVNNKGGIYTYKFIKKGIECDEIHFAEQFLIEVLCKRE